MKISFKLAEGAKLPKFATEGSSGFDLVAHNFKYRAGIINNDLQEVAKSGSGIEHSIRIKPQERLLVGTGLFCSMPLGFEMQIRPRSGNALKKGLTVLNSPGTIDSDYIEEIGVILYNSSNFEIEIKLGDKIAQGVITAVVNKSCLDMLVVDDLNETTRKGGFGHTGI